ncbi:MAG: DUF4235 domain-containing protein [Micrococcus sp.]|nr:DUF4235 domain-containing protein [Micrococcus sp.]
MNTLVNKLITTGVTVVGGLVATKVVEFGWKKVTGHDAPKDLEDTDNNMWEAIAFATVAAGIAALIRVTSQRGAHEAIERMQARSSKPNKAGRAEV